MDGSKYCNIPIIGKITIDTEGRLTSEYEYSPISADVLADLLLRGFGMDVEDLFSDSRDNDPAA